MARLNRDRNYSNNYKRDISKSKLRWLVLLNTLLILGLYGFQFRHYLGL